MYEVSHLKVNEAFVCTAVCMYYDIIQQFKSPACTERSVCASLLSVVVHMSLYIYIAVPGEQMYLLRLSSFVYVQQHCS